MPDAVEFIRGYYGKVPVRGDFVHAGFPRDFNDPWHDWQSRVIAGSRTIMGEAWLDAFLEAPVWRFVLSGGLCGARAAIGLILPSVDKVGRYFPLTLAALSDAGTPDAEAWSGWLDSVEDLGRQALDDDAPPEHLLPPPAPSAASFVDGTISTWWTDGGPRVEPTRLTLACLPDAPCYASMLGFSAATESAS
jgi:type VI secretion system protein ImpM